jgi:hypothetical protein
MLIRDSLGRGQKMIRGVSFEISNKYGSYLAEILMPVDVAAWM